MLPKKFEEAVANSVIEWMKKEVPAATELEAAEAGYRLVELLRLLRKIEEKKEI